VPKEIEESEDRTIAACIAETGASLAAAVLQTLGTNGGYLPPEKLNEENAPFGKNSPRIKNVVPTP